MAAEKPGHNVVREERWSRLMTAAQAGDRASYEELLRDCVPFIRAVVARQHRRPDRIEDAVQDVLLTVHRVRHTYDPRRPFAPWLAAIARRRSIDLLRRLLRAEAHEVADEHAYETFADPAANKDKEAADRAAELGLAVSALPEGQRQAIELVKLREMTLEEAAHASGKSPGSLKVSIHRAIKALKAQLKGA
jgi:RNA polymerase sigma-70 factor (ECF subfamily)